LHGRKDVLSFGVWSSLSRESFQLYMGKFGSKNRTKLPPMFGWFSNSLPGYPETLNLQCHVHPQARGLRPLIVLEPSDHPFAIQKRDGISFAEAVAYVHEHLAI
jgi:hypothetical protein